jgi:hypothetical protein
MRLYFKFVVVPTSQVIHQSNQGAELPPTGMNLSPLFFSLTYRTQLTDRGIIDNREQN